MNTNLLADTATDYEVIAIWLESKAKTSQITYRSTIKAFMEFVNKPLTELTLEDINLWLRRLKLTYKPATINNKTVTIKGFFTFCYKVGYLDKDLGIILKAKPIPENLNEKCLDVGDVRSLINATSKLRDKVLLTTIFSLGLRVSEATALKWTDLKDNKLTVLGKGNKTRVLVVSPQLLQLLHQLPKNHYFIFPNRFGTRLSRQAVLKIIKNAAITAGINPKVSCHWLRHSHATAALKNGCDIYLLKESLGHSNISTTQKYLSNNPEEGSSLFVDF